MQKNLPVRLLAIPFLIFGLFTSANAEGFPSPDMGKLLATGGVNQVEGAGGGGLTPWALITGYGTRDSYGANAHYSYLETQDYSLDSHGVAIGIADRVEFSLANHEFKGTGAALNGIKIKQDILGLKVKLVGDAVYDQDSWIPQIAIGLQHKRNKGIKGLEGLGITKATNLGARRNEDTDYYVSATKIFLAQSLLVNGTVRFTRANQFGLLGFGGPNKDKYEPQFEGSLAFLINRHLAIGAEYRDKPRNLPIDDEKAAYDAFIAWFPIKNVSLTAAYVHLGDIVKAFNTTQQKGPYVSLQIGF